MTEQELNALNNGQGRVVFLEPNDIYGKVDGRTITPDYTDFCIGFKLMAELVGRNSVNEYGGKDEEKRDVSISWMTRMKYDGKSWVSFTDGSHIDGSKRKYLTTYYTDISASDVANDNIIEGLGVESVDISFQNYFVPTVKIRFVDVRGSAIFSREEALHVGDKLTSENVFGCFFTVPYPKFRMQVKGYYGKAVTYQLYCSNFKGSFNASNGYFEADVSFVGYTYGILSDIPMGYIMASPYCKYCGSDYWDKHSSDDPEWKLADNTGNLTENPVRLMDLRDNIRNTIAGDRDYLKSMLSGNDKIAFEKTVSDKDVCQSVISSYNSVINSIGDIKVNVGGLMNTEIGFSSKWYNETEKTYYFKMSVYIPKPSGDMSLVEPQSETITDQLDSIINQVTEKLELINTKTYKSAVKNYNSTFSKTYDDGIYSDNNKEFDSTNTNYSQWKYNITFTTKRPDIYTDALANSQKASNEVLKVTLKANESAIQKEITIATFLKMYPYIGNVFKDVMCHLETFMYIFKSCIDEIKGQISSGDRTFAKMKIPISNSDVNTGDVNVPPFPGITIDNTENTGDDTTGDNIAVASMMRNVGWIGDFGENAEIPEVKFVNSIFDALLTRNDNKNKSANDGTSVEMKGDDEEKQLKENRDMKVAIYMHLKNLYDRWVSCTNFEEYTTKTLMGNITFMDSFFRDISGRLHLNPKIIGDLLDNATTADGRLLKFLDQLVSKHHCMIFGFPDTFIFANDTDADGNSAGTTTMMKKLVEAFTPIPYNAMGEAKQTNKIVVVYTYRPSEIVNEDNGYKGDYFDVYSDGVVIPSQLQNSGSGYGTYMIPSFGVTFGRQDNAIFKSVNVTMENPVATEQAILAQSSLAMKVGSSKSKIQYYGQDIYQVYSGYSYFCEFDMMGCMQITPMMYFQLLNIPMFRGAYMVISVSHSIRQGDMITHVKGMRLSRNALPLTKSWFVPDNLSKIAFNENGEITNLSEILNELTTEKERAAYYDNAFYSMDENVFVSDDYNTLVDSTKKESGIDERYKWLLESNGTYPYGTSFAGRGNYLDSMVDGKGDWNSYKSEYMVRVQDNVHGSFEINKRLVDVVKKILQELDNQGITVKISSSLRSTKTSSGTISNHMLGAAIDICAGGSDEVAITKENLQSFNNPWFNQNEYKKLYANKNSFIYTDMDVINTPENLRNPKIIRNEYHEVVKTFAKYGWGWGGYYGDTMHFSFLYGR